jgi:hypothetical protein
VTSPASTALGVESKYTLSGGGFGKWSLDPHAQDKVDSAGRTAPRVAKKEMNISALAALQAEHPDWSRQQLAEKLGVTARTIDNWRKDLLARSA